MSERQQWINALFVVGGLGFLVPYCCDNGGRAKDIPVYGAIMLALGLVFGLVAGLKIMNPAPRKVPRNVESTAAKLNYAKNSQNRSIVIGRLNIAFINGLEIWLRTRPISPRESFARTILVILIVIVIVVALLAVHFSAHTKYTIIYTALLACGSAIGSEISKLRNAVPAV